MGAKPLAQGPDGQSRVLQRENGSGTSRSHPQEEDTAVTGARGGPGKTAGEDMGMGDQTASLQQPIPFSGRNRPLLPAETIPDSLAETKALFPAPLSHRGLSAVNPQAATTSHPSRFSSFLGHSSGPPAPFQPCRTSSYPPTHPARGGQSRGPLHGRRVPPASPPPRLGCCASRRDSPAPWAWTGVLLPTQSLRHRPLHETRLLESRVAISGIGEQGCALPFPPQPCKPPPHPESPP